MPQRPDGPTRHVLVRRLAWAAVRLAVLLVAAATATGCAAFFSARNDDSGQSDLAADRWKWVSVPGFWEVQGDESLVEVNGEVWYRCFVRVPEAWRDEPLLLTMGGVHDADEAFCNGHAIGRTGDPRAGGVPDPDSPRRYAVPAKVVRPGEWNLLALRVWNNDGLGGITEWHSARSRSIAIALSCRRGWMDLSGRWQLCPDGSPGSANWPFLAGKGRMRRLGEAFATAAGANAPGRLEDLIAPPAEGQARGTSGPLVLRYEQPALDWGEALPLGNGRLGAMVFGRVRHERISLNCASLWSGQPYNGDHPEALTHFPAVREAVARGRFDEAQRLAEGLITPVSYARAGQEFEPLGDLRIALADAPAGGQVEDYSRELDLERGVARTAWRSGGARYTRDVFASAPAGVLVVRITCDQPGRISLFTSLDSQLGAETRTVARDYVVMRGIGGNHANLAGSVAFEVHLRVRSEGGRVLGHPNMLEVRGANAVTLLIAAGTSATDFRATAEDSGAACEAALAPAMIQPYPALLAAHEADLGVLLGRTGLHLSAAAPAKAQPGPAPRGTLVTHPELVERLFAEGRYLLASSSRPGPAPQPANAQGIWSDSTTPPHGARLRLSGPTPAAYWPAEIAGLAECAEPLVTLAGRLAESGRTTARAQYNAPGWVAHHQTDFWCATAPSESVATGLWPCGGAWLCHHLWDRYAFGPGDREYLRQVYPTLRGAAEFFLTTLQPTSREAGSRLAVNPSISPDNSFATPRGRAAVSDRAASDAQLVDDLLAHCARAAEILAVDGDLRTRIAAVRARLHPVDPPLQGPLPQWSGIEAHAPTDTVPHLFALYPGDGASAHGTPQYVPALRGALEEAGPGRSAWTCGWRAALWARLENGDRALDALSPVATSLTLPNLMATGPSRVFELAGNGAFTAAVAEMLVQSHTGCAVMRGGAPYSTAAAAETLTGANAMELHLLPALPAAWPSGNAHGLRARGGHEVAVTWHAGRLARATLRAGSSGQCFIRSRTPIESVREADDATAPAAPPQRGPEDGTIVLQLQAGKTYEILGASASAAAAPAHGETAPAANAVRTEKADADYRATAEAAEEEALRAPLEAAPEKSASEKLVPNRAAQAAEAAHVAQRAADAAHADALARAAKADADYRAAAEAAEEEALRAPLEAAPEKSAPEKLVPNRAAQAAEAARTAQRAADAAHTDALARAAKADADYRAAAEAAEEEALRAPLDAPPAKIEPNRAAQTAEAARTAQRAADAAHTDALARAAKVDADYRATAEAAEEEALRAPLEAAPEKSAPEKLVPNRAAQAAEAARAAQRTANATHAAALARAAKADADYRAAAEAAEEEALRAPLDAPPVKIELNRAAQAAEAARTAQRTANAAHAAALARAAKADADYRATAEAAEEEALRAPLEAVPEPSTPKKVTPHTSANPSKPPALF